jgi:hypothetical protein
LEGQSGSQVYKTPQLTSPDGLWRAYASVEAKPDPTLQCSDTSTLLIAGPGEASFQPVHTIKPDRQMIGNGMKPISWSTQRHLLAVRVLYWQCAADAGGFSPLIYDGDRKRVIEPDFAKLFSQKYSKKECAVNFGNILGFDAQSRVLFSADDVIDPGDEEPVPETRCLGDYTLWALDIDSNQLEPVKH